MVLLCIPSQFGMVKFGWDFSGLVCGVDEFGLVWLSLSLAQLSSLVYELVFIQISFAVTTKTFSLY